MVTNMDSYEIKKQLPGRDLPDILNMWGCMFAVDLAIKNLLKKIIAIIGDTRIGKSTLFNYILKIRLIGIEIQEGIDTVY